VRQRLAAPGRGTARWLARVGAPARFSCETGAAPPWPRVAGGRSAVGARGDALPALPDRRYISLMMDHPLDQPGRKSVRMITGIKSFAGDSGGAAG